MPPIRSLLIIAGLAIAGLASITVARRLIMVDDVFNRQQHMYVSNGPVSSLADRLALLRVEFRLVTKQLALASLAAHFSTQSTQMRYAIVAELHVLGILRLVQAARPVR